MSTVKRRPGDPQKHLDATCYGCIHLRYRGPSELRDRANEPTAIPLNEGDARHEPGHYSCGRYGTRIVEAGETPRELETGCKERR